MKFTNVVAYCKGWYKKRPIKARWMDLAHCLYVDGYAVFKKEDVANWCLFYIDNETEYFKPGEFIKSMLFHQNTLKVSIEDAIIITFCSYVSQIPGDKFTEGVKPSHEVLPFSLKGAHISDGNWQPAEMMDERLSEIYEMFPDFEEQELCYPFYSFENIESNLNCNDFRDILVLSGTDSLIDCEETIVTGNLLNNQFSLKYGIDGKRIELGIYKNCKFDDCSKYIIRYKKNNYDCFGLTYYTVKSIKEEHKA